jgi:hypothetical protein
MAVKITKFRAGWRPNDDKGRIWFQTADGKSKNLDLGNPAEFTAILTLLSSAKEVTIDEGVIWTGAEEVD